MASSLNRAQVIGNLTRDPDVRQTPNGQTVATLGIATNRKWKDQSGQLQEEVEFHNIVVWGRLAEICGQYLKKGAKTYFDGRLKTRMWEDPDGKKNYKTEIVAENMIMLGGRGEGAGGGSYTASSATGATGAATAATATTKTPPSARPASSAPQNDNQPAPAEKAKEDSSSEASAKEEIKIDDLPF